MKLEMCEWQSSSDRRLRLSFTDIYTPSFIQGHSFESLESNDVTIKVDSKTSEFLSSRILNDGEHPIDTFLNGVGSFFHTHSGSSGVAYLENQGIGERQASQGCSGSLDRRARLVHIRLNQARSHYTKLRSWQKKITFHDEISPSRRKQTYSQNKSVPVVRNESFS